MIIGNGDIAKVLTDKEDIIYFCSGVSNSREERPIEFEREMKLLLQQPRNKHLVYFSSLSIYYAKTEYARHKRIMEKTIRNHWESFTIVRLGNIDWGINPNTLINYLKAHPDATVQNVYRHIVSIDEFKYWLGLIKVGTQNEMNIPGKMVYVPHLFRSLHPLPGRDIKHDYL